MSNEKDSSNIEKSLVDAASDSIQKAAMEVVAEEASNLLKNQPWFRAIVGFGVALIAGPLIAGGFTGGGVISLVVGIILAIIALKLTDWF